MMKTRFQFVAAFLLSSVVWCFCAAAGSHYTVGPMDPLQANVWQNRTSNGMTQNVNGANAAYALNVGDAGATLRAMIACQAAAPATCTFGYAGTNMTIGGPSGADIIINSGGVGRTVQISVNGVSQSRATGGGTIFDLPIQVQGSANVNGFQMGQITLAAGVGSFTLPSTLFFCVCTDSTANASVKCSVTASTLNAVGTGTDVVSFVCIK